MSTISPILNYTPPVTTPLPPVTNPALPSSGYLVYWPSIQSLTGTDPTSLQAQHIYLLPGSAIVEVNIPNRGASQWLVVQDVTTPTTDINAGRIVPLDYDPLFRPYVLIRVAGY